MNESSKVIVKNTSVLLVSQIITWVFGALVTIILSRYVGPSGAGQFAIAGAIWMILGNLISFGSDGYLIKEIARAPEKAGSLMGTVLVLRAITFVIGCVGLAIYLYFMHYPMETLLIIMIISLSQPFGQLLSVITDVLQGIERMEYISLTNIVSKALNVVLVFLAVTLDLGIYVIAALPIAVVICSLFIQGRGMQKYIKLQFNFDHTRFRSALHSSLPFVVSGFVLTAYFQMDTLIMATLVDTRVMGWYSVAITIFSTFLFLPTILSSVLFPTFARTYGNTSGSGNYLLSKSIDLMFLFGVPIGMGITSISTLVMPLLYGKAFAPASTILGLMGFVLIFTYLTTVIGQYTVATDRIHIWTMIMVVALGVTIPLDFWLIPLCERYFGNGGIGGAITFLLTESGMAAAGILLLPKGTLRWSNVRVAISTVIGGLCMMAACWFVQDQFILVPIIIGGLTYIIVIFFLRVVPREDMMILITAGRGIIQRVRSRQAKITSPNEV
jgi:O-antigen/teichoic acid export membrane protein